MNRKSGILLLASALASLLTSGCLVKETVTVNGEVREDEYKIKHPLEEVIENSR